MISYLAVPVNLSPGNALHSGSYEWCTFQIARESVFSCIAAAQLPAL